MADPGRRSLAGALLIFGGIFCHADRATAVQAPSPPEWANTLKLEEPATLTTPTYEGSGQAVHPDFAAAPSWWPGRDSYLAMTPYPGGDFSRENPSLLASMDPVHWRGVVGGPDPVVTRSTGYLSDPDIVFNADTHELWMYYRYVGAENVIELVRSNDGRTWSPPVEVAKGVNHTIVSPAVVRRGPHDWWMWAVDAGPAGCTSEATQVDVRRSTDGRSWTAPRRTNLPSPANGHTPWHIDVQWIPTRREYWAVFNAKSAGNCGTTALFLATSPDGENWTTRPAPLLVAGEVPALGTIVYRTTFAYNAVTDDITFWYSGAGNRDVKTSKLTWRTVAARRSRAAVFKRTSGRFAFSRRKIPRTVNLPNPP